MVVFETWLPVTISVASVERGCREGGNSRRECRPARRYGVVGGCGERSTSRVISLGAKTRKGGPQKPVPRLV